MKVFKRQLIGVLISCIFLSSLGVCVYAEDSTDGLLGDGDVGVTDTSDILGDTVANTEEGTTTETVATTTEVTTTTERQDLVVSENVFTGLETLVSFYAPEDMEVTNKALLIKALTSLVVSVITGDVSYTLETFKEAFIEICVQYGMEITDDFLDALSQYLAYYLDSEFEQNSTDMLLTGIYCDLGFIVVLLIALWQGGGNFR